ncbi:MAG: hypothetical protein KDI02_13525 [Anaerolineae bacterium]|nr:hypothetical protein [Anaerolineae bacterium]
MKRSDKASFVIYLCLIDRDNLASINVARKIGMTFEKEGQDDKGPFMLYSQSKT